MHETVGSRLLEKKEAWLGLSLLPGWGPVRIWRALAGRDNPVPLWRHLKRPNSQQAIERTLKAAQARDIDIVTWEDIHYPINLRHISHPPPVLYLRGSLLTAGNVAIAVVGSRRASPQARQLAFVLARDLAQLGVTIVSGLAAGIDAAAHRGALSGGGRTIAVLGGAVENVYPRAHVTLAREIAASGAVVSQFPCGTETKPAHFPIRNRTLAGLALATVVVEAPARSGALITADFALDHGREVFACPGDPLRGNTHGSNNLLREGARPVQNAWNIIEDLSVELEWALANCGSERTRSACTYKQWCGNMTNSLGPVRIAPKAGG